MLYSCKSSPICNKLGIYSNKIVTAYKVSPHAYFTYICYTASSSAKPKALKKIFLFFFSYCFIKQGKQNHQDAALVGYIIIFICCCNQWSHPDLPLVVL